MIGKVTAKLLIAGVTVLFTSVAAQHHLFEFRAHKRTSVFPASHLRLSPATWQQKTSDDGESAPVRMPSPPSTPKLDFHACPFECCTFRDWKVTHKTPLFTTWRNSRRQIAWLQSGQNVTGLTGVHITLRPDKLQVLRAIPELNLVPGDIVLQYMYLGEGYAQFWFNGKYYPSEQLVGDDTMKILQEGRREWWVQIRTKIGQRGWALVKDNFDGMDACG